MKLIILVALLGILGRVDASEACHQVVRKLYRVTPMLEGYWKQDKDRRIKYFTSAAERDPYRLEFREGKIYRNGQLYDTSSTPWGYAIIVMDQFGNMFSALETSKEGFHHSTFFAGNDCNAGLIKVIQGEFAGFSNESGHYQPNDVAFDSFVEAFHDKGIRTEGKLTRWDGTNSVIPLKNLRLMHSLKHEFRHGF